MPFGGLALHWSRLIAVAALLFLGLPVFLTVGVHAPVAHASACNVTTTTVDGFVYVAFKTTSSTAPCTASWTPPVGVLAVNYVVVAGGGGGGNNRGGGGGAGGVLVSGAPFSVTPGVAIDVTVGNGGSADSSGSNSMFGSVTALGGGRGGSHPGGSSNGGNGGSGGGAAINYSSLPAWSGGTGVPGQGYAGAASPYVASESFTSLRNTGGGGGAGAAAVTSTSASPPPPDGGNGADVSAVLPASVAALSGFEVGVVSGSAVYLGGGGGGSSGKNVADGVNFQSAGAGSGGTGGGGSGGDIGANGSPGAPNSGGGGGGGNGTGGTGGSGVIILKYAAPSTTSTLSSLTCSACALSPAFSSGTLNYTSSVANSVSSVSVTPTVTDANATVTVDGISVASGSASSPISLAVGSNALTIVVTAQDGTTTSTYSLSVSRAGPSGGGGGGGGAGGASDPTPTPSPSISASPTPSSSPTVSLSPTPSPTATSSPTPTRTPRPERTTASPDERVTAETPVAESPEPTEPATTEEGEVDVLVEEEVTAESPSPIVGESPSPEETSEPESSLQSDVEAAPVAVLDAQPPSGQSLLTDDALVGPVMNLRVDLQIGASVEGRSAIVEAAGLQPGSNVQVLLYSEPMVIGTGVADGEGNASIATQIPGGLPPGQHTIMALGTSPSGNPVQSVGAFEITADEVVTRFVEPAQVSEPIDPEDPQIARALEAGKPLYDVALYPAVIATVAVAGAAVVGLAGAGGLAGTGSASSERSSRGKLAGVVTKKLKALKASDAGLGDRSRTWAMPGTRRTDKWIKALPQRAGKFSALLPRVLVDGAWSRAMFGSFGFVLWGIGLALGLWSAWSTGFEALPPALPLMLAIIALGILDAAAGAIAWVTIVVGALVTGNLTTWPEIRTALGLFVIFASIPLLAHVIRPLRRRISGTGMELFDRVADYVMPPVFLAFAAASMFKALNGLSGLELVSSEDFGEVRIVVIVAFLMRMAMEDVATYAYPVRSSEVQPEKLVSPGKGLALLSVAIRVGVFLIIAEPFFGLGWATYLSAFLIAIPMALKVYEDDLPNLVWLNKWYPRGVANFALLLVVGIYVSFWLLGQDATDEQVRQTYNFILLPGIVSGLIQLVGREGGVWPENWWKRAIGFVVWLFAVGIVTGFIALT